MKIKEYFTTLKNYFNKNSRTIYIISLVLTLLFSIFNRVLGIVKHSIWHETISIYYLSLVIIKGILIFFIHKDNLEEKEIKIYNLVKVLLIILNIFLIVPITLLVMNKRFVDMTLIPSIAVALYVTIKTVVSITQFFRKRNDSKLFKELRTVNLMDVTVSILTLTNTLISVNSTEFDISLHYLTIGVCIVGFCINCFLLTRLK